MRKVLSLVFLVVLLVTLLSAQQQAFKRFDAQSATGFTTPYQVSKWQTTALNNLNSQSNFVPSNYTITVTTTGSPATCSYRVLGSVKQMSESPTNADFNGGALAADIDCSVASKTSIQVVNKPWNTIIGQLVTLTGGSSPTVQLEVLAK